MKIVLPLLVLAILLTGCTAVGSRIPTPPKQDISKMFGETLSPEDECIKECKEVESSLDNGPCLLNPMSNPNWVCDVAHSPRQDIDNQQENQCSAFSEGKARHFVEVGPDCELIKKY